ncbi:MULTISPECIES: ExbD/TolR family protein [Flavobacterium]|uniref:Biopolymer transporter ExbD n=2 Tax=Flavobacterium TaxID=237 RepID=A0AA94F1R2_9FLAO|nr:MULTISPECIES: biopolymer transporter ExbD [Flavobacterium]OXA78794.1 biopolymer transporter ExbD [Flavobacterium columnare NBRC 100251 = ATCC 23463]AMA48378.1 biopolymer transporter ExbD [Flavobacterium covae]AND63462.1 biopolymer transporter ExbD [Flavobacterium covae]MCH4830305.1 biopolymer transporter ExbD [Flavobacterium columnare]MCH4832313.1 biopolymer transporter ExbD [Flavobacterium columnare]
MAKGKSRKSAGAIDMTAMCDVAFLLLTFFILTATAKQPEPLQVDTPNSTVQTKLPETGLVTLTVGKGKVFIGMKDREIRLRSLELMGQEYGINFTDAEKQRFSLIDGFGVPMGNLKQIIAMSSSDRNKEGLQPGVPMDSIDEKKDELARWIFNARSASAELRNEDLKFAIKGDAKLEYPAIKRVMDVLQKQDVNSFNLVTGLRSSDF